MLDFIDHEKLLLELELELELHHHKHNVSLLFYFKILSNIIFTMQMAYKD